MNPLYVGGLIGFGPALFLIWFSLRKYAYPFVKEGSLFEDRRVFFLLAVGMVIGTFLFVLEQFLAPLYLVSADTVAGTEEGIDIFMFMLVFVLAFPLIEDLAKFIILNFKGYQGRFDSTFYGISLGAGQSATWMVGYVFILMDRSDSIAPDVWLGLMLFSVSLALIHCSIGARIGSATGKKTGLRGLPGAILPHFIFNILLLPFLLTNQIWFSLIFVIPVSFIIYYGTYNHTLPECLPVEIQKELRRDGRRKLK